MRRLPAAGTPSPIGQFATPAPHLRSRCGAGAGELARACRRPALALLFVLLLALLLALHLPAAAQVPTPSGPHRAGLVVRFGDGHVETQCVAFSEPSITGEELLARSGFKANINPTGALGGALCSIDGSGCSYPSQDCFCKCVGVQCEYWAYYHWLDNGPGGGAWQYSQIGASAYQVTDGALEGWSWGPGNFSSGTEPPQVAFANVCPAGARTAPAASAPAGPASVAQYAPFALLAGLLLAMALLVLRRRGAGNQSTHEGARRITKDQKDPGAFHGRMIVLSDFVSFSIILREPSCSFVDRLR